MGKAKGKAPADKRKPKHSNDGNRANKSAKDGMRDAATVRSSPCVALPACPAQLTPLLL
jgi:hypothetical protein